MAITALILGTSGFIFCTAFGKKVDRLITRSIALAINAVRKLVKKKDSGCNDLQFITRLMASIRSGISLDSALDSLAKDPDLVEASRNRILCILQGRPQNDFLSTFLDGAMRTGIPLLATLQVFQKILQAKRRVTMKASALTSQSRAQAEVLSWLPWVLLLALGGMDPEWMISATSNAGSWLLWSVALGLLGLGRFWMKSGISRALRPAGKEEEIREQLLPELVLRMIAQLSLGQDAESALEACLSSINDPRLHDQIYKNTKRGESVKSLVSMLEYSARTGAPLREDLMTFLSDLYLQLENRWEERIQRLPVVMMAPLFICFFPASLLVIASLLVPLVQEVL